MKLPRFTPGQWLAGMTLLLAMLAMLGNEARLEHVRPAVPGGSYVMPVNFKNASGRIVTMYISRQDELGRAAIVAVFLGALGASVWLQKRGR